MNQNEGYRSPFSSRYVSREMSRIWSDQFKYSLWRKLWLELAKAERKFGLNITDEQIFEMSNHLEDIDFKRASELENKFRHDVMSHIHLFGEVCPKAKGIIHLGATSCFVTDNSELIQMRDSMIIISKKLLCIIKRLSEQCVKYAEVPVLGYTHFQVAQPTTVGKRLALYLQDLLMDFQRLSYELDNITFRGVKGTTGTQASFLSLFEGDEKKVVELDNRIAEVMGFKRSFPITGQTYTRKSDYYILSVLSGIAQSAHKFASDFRLSSHMGEMEEPFEKSQIGSSAMPYKKNPMRSERICAVSRYIMSLPANTAATHANQWFERTLDDSANRRIVLPEAFLATDTILNVLFNIVNDFVVCEKVIETNLRRELPFLVTENILMLAVRRGGNRQELHESIREHSFAVKRAIKEDGKENDLLLRIKNDVKFEVVKNDVDNLSNPKDYIGMAPSQVYSFVKNDLGPILEKYKELLSENIFDVISV